MACRCSRRLTPPPRPKVVVSNEHTIVVGHRLHPVRHVDGSHSDEPCGMCDLVLSTLVTSTGLFRGIGAALSSLFHRPRSGCAGSGGAPTSWSMRATICRNRGC